jgi:glycosyltransferase involved in cell wall biosynthesis
MHQPQIIGIVLVRNEESYVEQAILNILSFCDRLLLVDHESLDGTLPILLSLQSKHPEKISVHSIHHPRESHELIKPYVGTETWIFGVDGDEIYDPEGLLHFRKRLLSGEFDTEWMLVGNVLHVEELDPRTATGYMAPPSRSITKLYNFSAIESWDGNTGERLHGGEPHFRSGFHDQKKRKLFEESRWEEASLRCLHLCFIPRSPHIGATVRKNIVETYGGGITTIIKNQLITMIRGFLGTSEHSSWKQKHYARGQRVSVRSSPFFKNP